MAYSAGEGFNSDNQNTALTFDGNPMTWSGQALTVDANSDLTALGSTLMAGYSADKRDPIGYDGGTNLYGYAANNPLAFAGPSGHGIWGLVGGVAVGIGVTLLSGGNLPLGVAAGFAAGTAIAHYEINSS